MARPLHKLSAKHVSSATRPGYYSDGGNLYLQVSQSGSKSWIFRYTVNGQVRDMGLGSARDISLALARTRAHEHRVGLSAGIDPITARDERKPRTLATRPFRLAAQEFIEKRRPGWKSAKQAEQWANTLGTYAYPVIGNKDVRLIVTADIIQILDPIWQDKNETASRVRGRIESILDAEKVNGNRDGDNPAAWRAHLDHILPKPSKVKKVKHHPALPYDQVPAFVAELQDREGMAARALEFTILTVVRTSEATGARWSEFDLEKARWVIPAERMKAEKEHRVPLSPRAIEIVREMQGLSHAGFVFPSERDTELSNMTLLAVLKRMGRSDITVHGFRSSFRDWAAEVGNHPHELAEMALAHTIKNKAEAAYRRGDLFERRAVLALDWSNHCLSEVNKSAAVNTDM